MNNVLNVGSLLNWSAGEQIATRKGQRILRTATPSGTFWAMWRSQKAELQAAGVSVTKKGENWVAQWWQSPDSATSTQETPENALNERLDSNTEVLKEVPERAFFAKPAKSFVTPHEASKTGVKWSEEQNAIFAWFKSGKGSLVVQARAGTGKTTTIKEAFTHAPEQNMIYCVFNKKNQREAEEKITDPRVEVRTLHSLGFMFIKQVWDNAQPDDYAEINRLEKVYHDIPSEVGTQVVKLIEFAKNTFVGIPSVSDLMSIADERGIYAGGFEEEENGGWTVSRLAEVALRSMQLALQKPADGKISFSDMVWLPVAQNWVRSTFDLVVVDEAQDQSAPQLAMVRKACKVGGRICVVGDDRQAIYGFRGAASDGMGMMKEALNAATLGLTTTYRCPKAVVKMAAEIVPDYKAADSAPEGVIEYLGYDEAIVGMEVGNAVLSRLNAPLMGVCLALLRKGVSARIEGRDIGKQLVGIVKKLRAKSVPDFLRRLKAWEEKQCKRTEASGKNVTAKTEAVRDQADTLIAVAEGCANVSEIESRLLSLFQDSDKSSKPAVVCSSVHKAKGLEWNKVYLLKSTFNRKMGNRKQTPAEAQEEKNIYYVALTRAKNHLVLISERQNSKPEVNEKGEGAGAI